MNYFTKTWKLAYFCVMVNESCTCLIYSATLAVPKKGNFERHFMTRDAKYNYNDPLENEERKMKVDEPNQVHLDSKEVNKVLYFVKNNYFDLI